MYLIIVPVIKCNPVVISEIMCLLFCLNVVAIYFFLLWGGHFGDTHPSCIVSIDSAAG